MRQFLSQLVSLCSFCLTNALLVYTRGNPPSQFGPILFSIFLPYRSAKSPFRSGVHIFDGGCCSFCFRASTSSGVRGTESPHLFSPHREHRHQKRSQTRAPTSTIKSYRQPTMTTFPALPPAWPSQLRIGMRLELTWQPPCGPAPLGGHAPHSAAWRCPASGGRHVLNSPGLYPIKASLLSIGTMVDRYYRGLPSTCAIDARHVEMLTFCRVRLSCMVIMSRAC